MPVAKIGADAKIDVQVNGRGGVPATGVSAVVVNITETGSTRGGFFTVWPAGGARPVASSLAVAINLGGHATAFGFLSVAPGVPGEGPTSSTLNFPAGRTIANMAIVPVTPCDLCDPDTSSVRDRGQRGGARTGRLSAARRRYRHA